MRSISIGWLALLLVSSCGKAPNRPTYPVQGAGEYTVRYYRADKAELEKLPVPLVAIGVDADRRESYVSFYDNSGCRDESVHHEIVAVAESRARHVPNARKTVRVYELSGPAAASRSCSLTYRIQFVAKNDYRPRVAIADDFKPQKPDAELEIGARGTQGQNPRGLKVGRVRYVEVSQDEYLKSLRKLNDAFEARWEVVTAEDGDADAGCQALFGIRCSRLQKTAGP